MEYKRAMEHLLKNRECSPGSFSTGGRLDPFFPALKVKGVGTISLPLPEFHAQAIRDQCSLAPFGRKDETLYDEAVRKTWQLEPEDISIGNEDWDKEFMPKLITKVGEDLGLKGILIKYELYKLLLYDEGSLFKPHRDSEKVPGMFSTLVICLPSTFEGGELEVQHQKEKKIYDFGKLSETNIQYAAFYADCLHEVHLLKSGFRICLIYNLFYGEQKDTIPTALWCSASNQKAIETLELAGKEAERVTILLDHKYTQAELSFKKLKNNDRDTVNYFACLCEKMETPMNMYLAMYVRHENGDGSEWVYKFEAQETTYILSKFIDINDEKCHFGKIPIDSEDEIIGNTQPGEYHDEKSEDTGNCGVNVDRWYRRTVLVMVRPEKVCYFRARSNFSLMEDELSQLLKCSQDKRDQELNEKCITMCKCIANVWSTVGYKYSRFEHGKKALSMSIELQLKENVTIIFRDMLATCRKHLFGCSRNEISANNELKQIIQTVIEFIGIDKLVDAVKGAAEKFNTKNGQQYANIFEYFIDEFNHAGLIEAYQSAIKRIVSNEVSFSDNVKMINELMIKYTSNKEQNTTSEEIKMKFEEFLKSVVAILTEIFCKLIPNYGSKLDCNYSHTEIANLYQLAYHLSCQDCLSKIVEATLKVLAQEKKDFESKLIKQMNTISENLTKSGIKDEPTFIELSNVVYKRLKTELDKAKHLKTKPWTRNVQLKSKCTCSDCTTVDKFLSSQQKVWRLQGTVKRRAHIESKLNKELDITCNTNKKLIPHMLVITKTFLKINEQIDIYEKKLNNLNGVIPESVLKEYKKQADERTPLSPLTDQTPPPAKRPKPDAIIILD